MKKKISVLSLVLLLILSLVGCGSKAKEQTEFDQASMEQYAQMITQSFSNMSDSDFDTFTEMSDLELELTLLQSGVPVTSDNFLKMIDAWKAGAKDCGTIVNIGEFELETTNKDATMTAEIEGTERNGELVISFDEEMNMESMTINAEYSLNEILKKAGLNTLLGMGTVFVILIFISFIISLFKYIPNIQAKFSKKPVEEPKAKAAPKAAPAPVAVQTDDSELIAVIAAAIAAAEGTSTDGFVVRSIKRRKTNNWK